MTTNTRTAEKAASAPEGLEDQTSTGSAIPGRFRAIDVHAHFLIGDEAGVPPNAWTPESAIGFMDDHGIQLQLLSYPIAFTLDQARRYNDKAASVVAAYPQRFGLLASLPLGDPDSAQGEIGRALDDLRADGFVLVTNYDGKYFGDSAFDPIFAELDRRGAAVFVHPVNPAGFDLVSCGRPGPLIEFPMDMARTVVDAMRAGVFRRYRNMKMVLAHSGGVLPTLAPRIESLGVLDWVPNPQGLTAEEMREQLARLYYDTAISGTPSTLGPVLQTTSSDHVVFGTDYPPAGLRVIDSHLAALAKSTLLSREELAAIATNALHVFPSVTSRLRP